MSRDSTRIDSIQAALALEGLDLLVCALPTNVLLLTGYWPVVGTAVALVARGGPTLILAPEDERELAEKGWADEVLPFAPASLGDLRVAETALRPVLEKAAARLGARPDRIGYEHGGQYEPASYASLHLYCCALPHLLGEVFTRAHMAPADDLLSRLRSVKTPLEVEKIRLACLLAGTAFREGAAGLRIGERETDVAARFRAGLETAATEKDGVGRCGGFAYCMSGENAAEASSAYARSRQRCIRARETVLVHCNSYADGYWTDITRTYTLGKDDNLERLRNAVLAARAAALDAIRPGVAASTIDRLARQQLQEHGLGAAFKHATGHGVGLGAISHSARPCLHPCSEELLETGMVFNVEPAVYFDGLGGLRHCDVVAVASSGYEVLTPFQNTAADLVLPEIIAGPR